MFPEERVLAKALKRGSTRRGEKTGGWEKQRGKRLKTLTRIMGLRGRREWGLQGTQKCQGGRGLILTLKGGVK